MTLTKVLLIEDDTALRTSIAQTLELEDLNPIPTASFIQARRSIRSNFAGIVLSDIQMPDKDGFDILRFVNERDADLPVVLITGHSDVPTAMRAMKEGAYDYLEKPCEPDLLVETVRRALNFRALILENRAMIEERSHATEKHVDRTLSEHLEIHEREVIIETLRASNGHVSTAAQRLGVPRNTFYDRLAKFKIVAKSFRN